MHSIARTRRLLEVFATLLLAAWTIPALATAAPSFITFESGHVRPLALSPDGSKLFVVNTPNNTLVIYNITPRGGLFKQAEVSVGLEPVAVAMRHSGEVWVVNHLSDSVSIATRHAHLAGGRRAS
jgi:DNA-binding beta-propeller fold protein YncE